MSKSVLCSIENVTEVSSKEGEVQGTLSLVVSDNKFYLCFAILDGTPTQYITSVFDYKKVQDGDNWNRLEPFCFNCTRVSNFTFFENPYTIKINVLNDLVARNFVISDAEILSLPIFIEQIILNGIAVPSSGNRYSLEFYRNGHHGAYPLIPANIQLNVITFNNLEEFLMDVLNFFEKLMLHLDTCHSIPLDNQFPINNAAKAFNQRIIEKINDYISKLPDYEPITVENFKSAFDEAGKLKNPQEFKLRLFHSKKDKELLPELIPFALKIYPLDSTQAEREKISENLTKEFLLLQEQVSLIQQAQVDNNSKLFSTFRVIDHDVNRTDRTSIAFRKDNSPAALILNQLLKMYALYNPPISYLQGMNDLFVPILTAFIPNYSEDGIPIDKDGNELDYKPFLPMIFWCFESMVINTQQIKFLENVTLHCGQISEIVQDILNHISPMAAIWFRRYNMQGLLWCYSDFVLLFKRTFEDIWTTWFQFNACEQPDQFLNYFVAAILIASFDGYTQLEEISITTMMDAFPRLLASLDPIYLGKIALWIQENYRLQDNKVIKENKKDISFEFFHPSWK